MVAHKADQKITQIPKLIDLEVLRNDILRELGLYGNSLGKLAVLFEQTGMHMSDLKDKTSFYRDGTVQVEKLMNSVDKKLWQISISSSDVASVLSSEGETELRKRYEDNPAVYTADEAHRVVKQLSANSKQLAAHTIRSIFQKLTQTTFRKGNLWGGPKENRSHDGIRKSFRFSHFGAFGPDTYYLRDGYFDIFDDLELICRLIYGLPKLAYPHRLGDQMRQGARDKGPFPRKFSTPYFKLQVFKCGNVKIDFTCDKTLAFLNRYGSDGKTLVDPFGAHPDEKGETA